MVEGTQAMARHWAASKPPREWPYGREEALFLSRSALVASRSSKVEIGEDRRDRSKRDG